MQGMEDQTKPQNLVDMAKKRRHLHLVEKLAHGKPHTPALSPREISELAKFEGDPQSPGVVDSREKVSKIFGVAARTVERWVKDGMPIMRDGKYDLLEIRAWREFKDQKKGKAKKKGVNWEERYRKFKALLQQIAYQEKIGSLIPRELVEKELVAISLGVKTSLLNLPKNMAPQLEGLTVRQINDLMTRRIKEILGDFSDGRIILKNILIKKGLDEKTTLRIGDLDAGN